VQVGHDPSLFRPVSYRVPYVFADNLLAPPQHTHRYDVAISTACAALNYIVVESTSDAQRCVELLRRRQLGVATFLILEKQKGLAGQMNEAVQTPEGAGEGVVPGLLACAHACSRSSCLVSLGVAERGGGRRR
jgi:hypothetical protein